MAGLAFMPVWCAPGARWPRTLALVLRCAAALSGCLQAALGGSGGGSADGSGGCDDDAAAALRADGCSGGSTDDADRGSFLEDLRAHLHRGASAQVGVSGRRLSLRAPALRRGGCVCFDAEAQMQCSSSQSCPHRKEPCSLPWQVHR